MTSLKVTEGVPRAPEDRPTAPVVSAGATAAAHPAWRTLTSRKYRKIVLFCSLAGLLLAIFGVYAITQGPPPKVEAVVYFSPSATAEQKEAVRAACPTVGNAVQLPADTSGLATSRVYPLRYDIAGASTTDRAALFACLHAQPNVVAISEFTQGQ